jgi:monovalent cation/hydrogen antiporter
MQGIYILLVIIGAIAVTAFARRRNLQPPLVVVALASVVSFMPGMPRPELPPGLILGVVLPPLLYSTALDFSFVSFTRNLWAIVALGVGLVVVSTVAVGLFASWVVPGLALGAALVLGAVLAPSDSVTAVAIGRSLCVPKRVMTILTGESLVNDAAALTLFALATAAVAGTRTFVSNPLLFFGYAAIVGIGVGLGLAMAVHWVRIRMSDPGLETVLGMVAPFAAYLAAEEVHASGVLSVVAAGFWLGHHEASAGFETRLQSRQVWRSMDVLLEAFVFAFMGLQLRFVIEDVTAGGVPLDVFLVSAALVLLAVMVIRAAWIFLVFGPNLYLRMRPWLIARSAVAPRLDGQLRVRWRRVGSLGPMPPREKLPWRNNAVMAWSGMRGVVTLAAAAGVPELTASGQPFPGRGSIQAIAFVVAVGTLLIQGSTLPPLIRVLGLYAQTGSDRERDETRRAQQIAREAARQATAQMISRSPHEVDPVTLRSIEQHVEQYLSAYQVLHEPAENFEAGLHSARQRVVRELIQNILAAQRRALVHERDKGRLDDEVLRALLEQLDYEEAVAARDVPSRLYAQESPDPLHR